ncbi:hypothetical protein RSOLAG1IB_06029 [Rhizoctonia solani AG-1 IB]|uniref:Fungal lipase-type domain-containing protein n=1 Tax=Thanatephorus cucumeris (strain AG1-IB / isolate 7/3/14) TaxID=1108050 RepID=M5CEM2_THACB|nr:hypothetical protein BN14_08485 [Rhizoctonia solani AG-1 IB]CEL52961.1 hypothetical protein RSOLAG1IB_06029 [Rhizoctonia solani AG-1 IB]
MSTSSFNTFQQLFALSWASNLVRECEGSALELQEKLAGLLNGDYLNKNVGPGWSIVWGPAVWRNESDPSKPGVPDNVWFVAKHDSLATDEDTPTPAYVVCIAGTAGGLDNYGASVEDKKVDQVVDLNSWIPNGFTGGAIPAPTPASSPIFTGSTPYVAYGTSIGTHIIASTPPATQNDHTATTPCLSEFLKSLSLEANARLIFTGHSLGGALSPTLALTLDRANLLGNFTKVLVYPTAGPTPGDANFVSEFSQRFPATPIGEKPYMTWNRNIVNSLDIVPHAWCTLLKSQLKLFDLPTLYGNSLVNGRDVFLMLSAIEVKLLQLATNAWPTFPKKNVYVPLPSSIFSAETSPFPTSEDELWKVAVKNHVPAYFDQVYSPGYKPISGPFSSPGKYPPMALGSILHCDKDVPVNEEAATHLREQLNADVES